MWMFDDRGTKIMMALALVIGMIGSASIVGEAISTSKRSERYVTVRGVAEKEVKADLAVWPIRIRVAGNDLASANYGAETGRKKVLAFLSEHGIKPEDIASQDLRVQDRQARDYEQPQGGLRYIVEYTILVRSADVDTVKKISQMTDKLVAAGVVLASQGNWDRTGPHFIYTQLNAIKPEMMASATKSAHEVATQFATDSGSTVGTIRRAAQGLFSITDRDSASQGEESGAAVGVSDVHKKVRVVVTVDYLLQ